MAEDKVKTVEEERKERLTSKDYLGVLGMDYLLSGKLGDMGKNVGRNLYDKVNENSSFREIDGAIYSNRAKGLADSGIDYSEASRPTNGEVIANMKKIFGENFRSAKLGELEGILGSVKGTIGFEIPEGFVDAEIAIEKKINDYVQENQEEVSQGGLDVRKVLNDEEIDIYQTIETLRTGAYEGIIRNAALKLLNEHAYDGLKAQFGAIKKKYTPEKKE